MRTSIKSNGWKAGLLLVLPALALGFWGFLASRPGPPVPFDKPHIKQEVISQVTKQLAGRSWQGGGEFLTFKEVHVLPAKGVRVKDVPSFVLRHDAIVINLLIDCEARVPTQSASFSSLTAVELKLARQKNSSVFVGHVRVPGYSFIRVSFPVTTPKPFKQNKPQQTVVEGWYTGLRGEPKPWWQFWR